MTSGEVHPAARVGFDLGAEAYERGRPSYPQDAVEFVVRTLGVGPGRRVLDLAAGTGKFTRLLAATGAELAAVEPVEGMRREFARLVPGVPVLEGTAEAIPLEAASVQAAVVAQAFHWFDGPAALAELHRVLAAGGGPAIVWNVRDDERSDFWAGLTRLLAPHRGNAPGHRSGVWRLAFDDTDLFEPLQTRSFRFEQRASRADVVDRVLSTSFIAALPETGRADVEREVLALLDQQPETSGSEVMLPYRTDVHWTFRR